MAPNPHKLTLSKDAFAHPSEAPKNVDEYPGQVRLVVCGSAGAKAIDSLAVDWKQSGLGKIRGKTTLAGIVYELGHGEQADKALEAFSVANEAPGNVPVTLVHPLAGGIEAAKLPPPNTAPPQATICFSLPTIAKAGDIQGAAEEKWLALFKEASERGLTLEIALTGGDESVREAVEKLLGKAWDEEAERAKRDDKDVSTTGVRIVFDALASPPLSLSSSQLLRSKELEDWSDFVRRLALHPRLFLKLSPLPLPSLLPGALTTSLRSADAPATTASSALAGAIQSATDAVSHAVSTAEDLGSPQDRRAELLRRLRIYLDTALEAFGEERLVWAAHMGAGSASVTSAAGAVGSSSLSEIEEWFEVCREALLGSGFNQDSLTKVFAE